MGQARIGGLLLLCAAVATIVWANVSMGAYEEFWQTTLTVGVADVYREITLHSLVNDALMTLFFFAIGLEVRREFAIGELTSWSRAAVPVVAAFGSLSVPAIIFLIISHGSGYEHAWGTVIAFDTAFVVSALAVTGPRFPGRLRVFLLAVAVVGVYTTRFLRAGRGPLYTTLAIVVWFGFLTTEDARVAANSLRESISINERLQARFESLVAYVVRPLFAFANAGVVLSSDILVVAAGSSVHGRSPWAWWSADCRGSSG